MGEAKFTDVMTECGTWYRYLSEQTIFASGKKAKEICIGDVLPDLLLPNVKAPCFCSVRDIRYV